MEDPNEEQSAVGETLFDVAEVGVDVAADGFVEMTIEGVITLVDATGEILGDVLA